jgi:ribose 5-phosphate isomerase A
LKLINSIPSSFQASSLILDNNLPLASLNEYPEIDVCFDGADEVDSHLNAIKGGGACLLQEKLVISASKKWYIVADQSKDSARLCEKVFVIVVLL